ncbi:uncharacterized protein LOC143151890 [Ptiloglossa arizonensis]|uniref:uncharacterized protein LOC143151890 n=1 Tax=Ptiloglossa arizonensis TaxID=3350558 RepID=UPI003FA18241
MTKNKTKKKKNKKKKENREKQKQCSSVCLMIEKRGTDSSRIMNMHLRVDGIKSNTQGIENFVSLRKEQFMVMLTRSEIIIAYCSPIADCLIRKIIRIARSKIYGISWRTGVKHSTKQKRCK